MDELSTSHAEFLRGNDAAAFIAPLVRRVAEGRAVDIAAVAAEAGLPVDALEAWFRAQPGADWDDRGQLVGFGLTPRPTAHRFTVGDRVLYTFCAADALLFMPIIGQAATAESTCPATGRAIRIELTPDAVTAVDPAEAVVSRPVAGDLADIRASMCDHGHFFASPDAARSWLAEHPGGDIRPVAEFFDIARELGREMGWACGC